MTSDIWLTEPQQRAWRAFVAMQAQLLAALARQLQRDSSLSAADFEILVNLSEADAGRLRAYQLGEATRWEKSRLSHHLTRMEGRGLVSREPCPSQPRFPDVVLTETGREAIEEAAPKHVEHVREWFIDALSPEQLEKFAEACEAVMKRLDEATGCTPAEACAEPAAADPCEEPEPC